MDIEKVKDAKEEAVRFLRRVDELETAIKEREIDPFYGSKYTSAVKRSSLDLTRALAELRK